MAARIMDLSPRSGPVLVGVGGSNLAATLGTACEVSRHLGRDMEIVSVVDPFSTQAWESEYLPGPGPLLEEDIAASRLGLQREIELAIGNSDGFSLVLGDVPRMLSEGAEARKSPLVIVGIGRRRPFDGLLGHAMVYHTVRYMHCPLLAIAPGTKAIASTVVVGVDFSSSSVSAAQDVLPLMEPGGVLHLVHVWQPTGKASGAGALADAEYRRALPERFRRYVARLDLPSGICVQTEEREGHAAQRLLEFAGAHHADLIALGHHSRGLIERFRAGNVIERVLRGAACSVFVVPQPDDAIAEAGAA